MYQEQSFSKAAQKLYISQPSLSATIKKIEKKVGAPLFERNTTPIQLTRCGEEYIKCAKEIMDIENGFTNFVSNIDQLKAGMLSVGGSNLFTSYVLLPIIAKFKETYPAVDIRLVEANTSLLENHLQSGYLDLIIETYPFNPQLFARDEYCAESLLLAVPKRFEINDRYTEYQLTAEDIRQDRHILPETPCVPLVQFKNEPFLFLRHGNDTRIRAEKICKKHGFSPKIVLYLDQQITCYHVSCYGMGISFISDTLIKHVKDDANIIYYRVDGPNEVCRSIYFYYKQGKYITRAMEEFIRIAREDRKAK